METQKKRRTWLAMVFSLLVPGLGQLYNGQLLKSLIVYGLNILFILSLRVCFANFTGAALWFSLFLIFYLVVLIDALLVALKRKAIVLTPYTHWYVYLCIVLMNIVLNSLMVSFPYKPYVLPASSMEPSLHIGDRFIVETRGDAPHEIARGDIVVFPSPDDPARKFVKRVIGLPGETLKIIDKRVVVNEQVLPEPYTQYLSEDTLPSQYSPRDNFGPIVIPAGSVFVLGDNRESSLDSRFWKNTFVTIDSITGKALYLYWANNVSRIGLSLE